MIKALRYTLIPALALLAAWSAVQAGGVQGYAYTRGVVLSEAGNRYWATTTGNDGQYDLDWFSIPCPLFFYSTDAYATARFSYRRFNPKNDYRGGQYYVKRAISETCQPDIVLVPFFGPFPLSLGNVVTQPQPLDFPVDVMVLSGTAGFEEVAVGETTQYAADDPDHERRAPGYYDYDDDGTNDFVQFGHMETDPDTGKKVFVAGTDGVPVEDQVAGVYFSGGDSVPGEDPPDVTRVVDRASFENTNPEGLLSQISQDDLADTDLYVVRLADGKLIAERIGLNEYETGEAGTDAAESRFFYSVQLRDTFGDLLRFKDGRFRAGGRVSMNGRL